MARYIDADRSVEIGYLSNWYQASIDDTIPPIWTDEHLNELTNDFIIIPKDTPIADVALVKHGEWVKSIPYNRFMNCSVCGFFQDHTEFNYCPNCGAKMDGGGGA